MQDKGVLYADTPFYCRIEDRGTSFAKRLIEIIGRKYSLKKIRRKIAEDIITRASNGRRLRTRRQYDCFILCRNICERKRLFRTHAAEDSRYFICADKL